MPGYLRQSTASQSRALGPFVDDTDFKTPETALSIANTDIKLIANGAASANKNSGGATHRANGVYGVTFDATDTATVGELEVSVVVAGALPIFDKFTVIEEAVYDNNFVAGASYAGLVDLIWDEVLSGATHNIVNSAARRLRALAGADVLIWSGTAQAGSTSTTIKLDSGAPATTNIFKGSTVVLTGATGAGQVRRIVDYNGTTKVASVDRAWVITPDATTAFEIVAGVGSRIADEGTAQAGASGSITLAATASASDNVYNDSLVTIQAGTGSGQTKIISAYNGTTKVATVTGTFSPVPDSTSIYAVIPSSETAGDVTSTPAEIAAAVFVRAFSVAYGSYTFDQLLGMMAAVLLGKSSGMATTTGTFRNLADSADVVVATQDASGNRSAVTRTP